MWRSVCRPAAAIVPLVMVARSPTRCSAASAADADGAPDRQKFYASRCVIPTEFTPYKLKRIEPYNHDTSIFTFELQPGQGLGLPTCGCLLIKAPGCEHGGGDAIRAYTPISKEDRPGSFQMLIKRYAEWGEKPSEFNGSALHASYRPAGAVSNFLHTRKPGDPVLFAHRSQNLKIQYPFPAKQVLMICVGAGIAPMLQALEQILENENDRTKVTLLYGNRSVRDILMKEKLDAWSMQHPDRLKVVFAVGSRWANVHVGVKRRVKKEGYGTTIDALSRPPVPEDWDDLELKGNQAKEVGWVDLETIRKHGFPPGSNTKVFVCGLPGVYEKLCGARGDPMVLEGTALAKLGFDHRHVVKF